MLFLIWFVLCLVGICLILLPAALWLRVTYRGYSGSRLVACPENQQAAVVGIDARHAAATGMHGCPDLRLCECTRWPERAECGQPCLSQAVQTEPYAPVEVKGGPKQIYHLPVVLAAFAAWGLGAIWHAQYLFRPRWTDAVGLTHAQVSQIVWWISPHLLTLAVCLLFAYGVAWLLAISHRKGLLQGVLMAVLLSAALVAASCYSLAALPHALLAIEAGYVVLATVTMGAVVGGLYDKLVMPQSL
ncbi:MAG TPA: DUF1761 domain-containing protein [Acidobacteriaceae bacterium]|nr:DUF1761 domain-containing protein [Acidobacteriaceae bacterium]